MQPRSAEELAAVLRRCAEQQVPVRVLGGGCNLLVRDEGVHGVVPDLAMARGWYEKAKKFGAMEATQRLELLASKQH